MRSTKVGVGVAFFIFTFVIVVFIWRPLAGNKIISESSFEGVIFTEGNSANLLGVMLVERREEGAYWTPQKSHILALEEQLTLRVQEQLPLLATN
jgi:hypothetical protein